MSLENGLRRLGRYGIGKLPDPGQPGDPNPHRIGDPNDPGSGGLDLGFGEDNPYKLDPYWGHPTPGPGHNPDDPDTIPLPRYMHSLATPALKQAGYNPYQANQLIRLARRQGLEGLQQGPSGAYHDPTQTTYDPTPPTGKTSAGFTDWSSDPNPSDTRAAQPTDPNYYGGFKSPGVQQGLEAVSARWAPKRAARAARQAARGPR